ncbi:hypothetical protein ACO2Q1_07590 [Brevundimonas sp. VNH65]|uniref:hypothetical protein n=1 Tax=Brevundimonas sp. VNH65 TaxID=3400917 RepID=UPI003C0DE4A2
MIVLTTGAGALCALIGDRRWGRPSPALASPPASPSQSRDPGRGDGVSRSLQPGAGGLRPV